MNIRSDEIKPQPNLAGSGGGGTLPARAWGRIPIAVRAMIVGLSVSLIGALGTGIPMQANLKWFPDAPWSLPVSAMWLWLFWRYLNGRGWPRATSARRREWLRARPLSARLWRWSLLTCGLLLAFNLALAFARSRFLPSGMSLPGELLTLPPATLIAVLLTISAQAGVVEEAAFRGYMFTPIERRHGPVAATLIVSLVFVLAHFNNPQNLSAYRILSILAASVVYCVLVLVTGSILPGLVAHGIGDAIGLMLLWRAEMHRGLAPPRLGGFTEALQDSAFLAYAAAALVLGCAAIWAFVRLRQVARLDFARSEAGKAG